MLSMSSCTAEKHVIKNRKFQDTPYGKDMYCFDIFINNGRICMGFEADIVEKVQKLAYLIRLSKNTS